MEIFREGRKYRHKLRCGGCAWLAALLCLQLAGTPMESAVTALSAQAVTGWEEYPLVAHAVGSTETISCVPSLETFTANYALGYRLFECDFQETSDGHVVLRHDWSAGVQAGIDPQHVPTLAEFLATPLYGEYTPLSFSDLLSLMERYPDCYIITDSKSTDDASVARQFTAMVETARAAGKEHLLSRFVVQLYSLAMHDTVAAVYPFSHYMLTLYQTGFDGSAQSFASFAGNCAEKGIRHIVMWHYLYREEFRPIMDAYNISVYVHTVNDTAAAASFIDRGVSGVYSDRIRPEALECLRSQ